MNKGADRQYTALAKHAERLVALAFKVDSQNTVVLKRDWFHFPNFFRQEEDNRIANSLISTGFHQTTTITFLASD